MTLDRVEFRAPREVRRDERLTNLGADLETMPAAVAAVSAHSQTMGVNAGVSQRVAREILGHSDPALTANVYTDLPAVGMHEEVGKLPWVGSNA
ncbi:MAG: hypothetical protein WDM96_05755 [Lacunisphaera sp.]